MKVIHIKVAYWIHKIEYIYFGQWNKIRHYINELIYGKKKLYNYILNHFDRKPTILELVPIILIIKIHTLAL